MPTPNQSNALQEQINNLTELMSKGFSDQKADMSDLRTRVDGVAQNQVTRADLQSYVLKEVHDVEIKRLDGKDAAQQEDLNGLLERELSQGQRLLAGFVMLVGVVISVISLIHSFFH